MGYTGDGGTEDQIIYNDTNQSGKKPLAALRIMRK